MRNGPYILIIAPPDFPGKKYRGRYAYEHRVNFWKEHGYLPEIVHHDNENKHENAIGNLVPMARGKHSAIHAKPVVMVELVCAYCGITFTREARNVNYKRTFQERFYCCRSHLVKYQWQYLGHYNKMFRDGRADRHSAVTGN